MTIQELINRTLARYGYRLADEMPAEEPMEETAEPTGEATSKTLEDGTEIFSDGDFATGSSVYMVTDEGEQIPLPTGEYTCSDGTVLVIEDGVVTGGEEEAPAEDMPAEMSAALQEIRASYESRIAAQKAKINALERKLELAEVEATPRVRRQSVQASSHTRVPQSVQGVYKIFETYN